MRGLTLRVSGRPRPPRVAGSRSPPGRSNQWLGFMVAYDLQRPWIQPWHQNRQDGGNAYGDHQTYSKSLSIVWSIDGTSLNGTKV
jgi:hypothetical protein